MTHSSCKHREWCTAWTGDRIPGVDSIRSSLSLREIVSHEKWTWRCKCRESTSSSWWWSTSTSGHRLYITNIHNRMKRQMKLSHFAPSLVSCLHHLLAVTSSCCEKTVSLILRKMHCKDRDDVLLLHSQHLIICVCSFSTEDDYFDCEFVMTEGVSLLSLSKQIRDEDTREEEYKWSRQAKLSIERQDVLGFETRHWKVFKERKAWGLTEHDSSWKRVKDRQDKGSLKWVVCNNSTASQEDKLNRN